MARCYAAAPPPPPVLLIQELAGWIPWMHFRALAVFQAAGIKVLSSNCMDRFPASCLPNKTCPQHEFPHACVSSVHVGGSGILSHVEAV